MTSRWNSCVLFILKKIYIIILIKKYSFFEKPFISFVFVFGNSNLTRENLRELLLSILFIDDGNLFSLDKISSDDISHVVDFRNCCLNIYIK